LPKLTQLDEITTVISGSSFIYIVDNSSGSAVSNKILTDNLLYSIELDNLGNISASSPNNGDVLTWNISSGSWVASEPQGGAESSVGSKLYLYSNCI
jgi:hypothetical protein